MTAFLLIWKSWPHIHIMEMLRILDQQGYVDEPWQIRA